LKGGQGGLTVVIVVDLKGVTFMTEKVLRFWLSALTVAVIVVSFLTVFLFRSRFEFLRVYRLEVISQGGSTSVVVGSNANGDGVIMLHDNNGTLRAAVGVTSTGDAAIDLFDGSGNQRVSIAVKVDGSVVTKGF
jgi:hypothetical protein